MFRRALNDDELAIQALDDAWARSAHGLRTGMRFGHRGELRALSLERVHRTLEARRNRYYKGSTMELLHSVACCAEENLPLPAWLAIAFQDVFNEFLLNGTSLDKVFTSPSLHTTPKRATKDRRDWQKGIELWTAVWEVAPQHQSLDKALDSVLSQKQHGWIKKTDARDLVTRIDVNQHQLTDGSHPLLSQFFKNSRKRAKTDPT